MERRMPKRRPKRDPKKLTIDVIEARAIVLVDEYGNERATLSCSDGADGVGGFTVIQIKDDAGRPRLELQVDPDGNPGIRLVTSNGAAGVSMSVSARGNGISVADFDGKPCISLGVPHPDSGDPRAPRPAIDVIDERGGRVWSVFDGVHELREAGPGPDANAK
jgi:hypothetical protein